MLYKKRRLNMCIFCKIVNKEIPNYTIYEDETVLAFLDVNPTSKGHTLVIPKQHFDSFLECDSDVLHHVFDVAQKIALKMEKELGCDGINVLSNVHEAAGQSVNHFHVHLIPRYKDNDSVSIEFNPIENKDFEDVIKKIGF
ncbi:HIT family protein [Floccifex sp.]|uniref:HIT family protein n=1 Tax=Floccifex sp. TaxID=2815810 RepID=UPI003F04F010|nr:HIT family protein [Erysipelotrichaceae bacterium]